jgi:hypothetical protein
MACVFLGMCTLRMGELFYILFYTCACESEARFAVVCVPFSCPVALLLLICQS